MKKLAVLMLGAVLAASTVGAGVAPKDSDAAVRTLRRQIGYVNDGQYDLAYRQIHPAQQALFSVDQYSRLLQEGFAGAKITLDKVKKTYRSTLTIPGTDVRARTVAVTVELTVKQVYVKSRRRTRTTRSRCAATGNFSWTTSHYA
jgi:hypothetical protein